MAVLPERASLDARPMPAWYPDAKLGIFVHWGLYSIPAFAERTDSDFTAFMGDLTAGKDTRGRVPYAEWYLTGLRVPGSPTPTARHHQATYGKDFSYFDFRAPFDRNAARVDFDEWAKLFAAAGARYVVMVTRHLDGYPLWPTTLTNPHVPAGYRSSPDLVGDLTEAVRARGLRMGLYYAGGLDWTFTTRPIRTMTDLTRQQALGAEYARYATAQWTELIDAYQPSVLWNDMGWPAESDPHRLFAHYYDTVEDGVVNDRWTQVKMPSNRLVRALYLRFVSLTLKVMARAGRSLPPVPRPSTTTSRPTSTPPRPGAHLALGAHRRPGPLLWVRRPGDRRRHPHRRPTGPPVGRRRRPRRQPADQRRPDGAGRIPDLQQRPLRELGARLEVNGEAVYATRPWTPAATSTTTGDQVRFTHRQGTVYAIVLADDLTDGLTIRGLTLPQAAGLVCSMGPRTSLGPRRPTTSGSRHPRGHPAGTHRS